MSDGLPTCSAQWLMAAHAEDCRQMGLSPDDPLWNPVHDVRLVSRWDHERPTPPGGEGWELYSSTVLQFQDTWIRRKPGR
jgi:hypothetical protein